MGNMYCDTDDGIQIFDKDKVKWVSLESKEELKLGTSTGGTTKQGRASGGSNKSFTSDEMHSNSWTNLQTSDVQEILSKVAELSMHKPAKRVRINEVDNMVKELNLEFGSGPDRNKGNKRDEGAKRRHSRPMEPAEEVYLPTPMGTLLGKDTSFLLRKYPQDLETHALQFQESNVVKDIYNWNQWQRAFKTFKALYLMAYPDKEPEMTKYENDIHVFLTQYYWNAVASYDLLFRQYLCDFPERSWAEINRDLFFSELAPN